MVSKRPVEEIDLTTPHKKLKTSDSKLLLSPQLKSKRELSENFVKNMEGVSNNESMTKGKLDHIEHENSETEDDSTDIECQSPMKISREKDRLEDKEVLVQEEMNFELDTNKKVEALQQMLVICSEKEILRDLAMAKYVRMSLEGPPDVCFLVENKPFHTYKNMLTFSSPKFKKMFEEKNTLAYHYQDQPEASSSKSDKQPAFVIDRFVLSDVSKEAFPHFLTMLFFKHHLIVDLSLLLDILKIAYDFEVADMIIAVENQLVPYITTSYLRKFLEVADSVKSEKLNSYLTRFEPTVTVDNGIDLLIAAHKHKNVVLKRRIMKQLRSLPSMNQLPGWDQVDVGLKDECIVYFQKYEVFESPSTPNEVSSK